MRKIILSLSLIGVILLSVVIFLQPTETSEARLTLLKEKYAKKHVPSVDHSKLPELQKNFATPQEVTATCISCHTERHTEIMKSSHWNWEREEYIEGRGIVRIGKGNAVNNFCIGTQGNEQSCAKCHIGFGMTDSMFTYTDPKNVDCMVCHDNSGTYSKGNELAGYPTANLNLTEIAQHIGRPKRDNCGTCHFFGGGGNNVKHGDLEKSMFSPDKSVDVHMAADGVDLVCVDCHTAENHQMLGKVYSLSSMNRDRSSCEQCHTNEPHAESMLNEHTVKVACQSCHIPEYAKVNSTKMSWDWSTAGKLRNGEPFHIEDSLGNHTYLSIKGTFTWDRNVKPDYIWFNGTADHYLLGDVVNDTTKPLKINTLKGSYSDHDSKIIPVKIHKARQPFDPVNKILIQPKLFSTEKGEGALWKDFDWQRASRIGMEDVNLPFSGQISFIETEMYWPLNHMVSSKEKTVQCIECHTRDNGRLAGLNDFYMPGRDYNSLVETAGVGMILLTFLGVATHGTVRVVSSRKKKKSQEV